MQLGCAKSLIPRSSDEPRTSAGGDDVLLQLGCSLCKCSKLGKLDLHVCLYRLPPQDVASFLRKSLSHDICQPYTIAARRSLS